jgi:hypothetical protein
MWKAGWVRAMGGGNLFTGKWGGGVTDYRLVEELLNLKDILQAMVAQIKTMNDHQEKMNLTVLDLIKRYIPDKPKWGGAMTFNEYWESIDKVFSKYYMSNEIKRLTEQAWNAAVEAMLDQGYQINLDKPKWGGGMIISASIIYKPRTIRRCESCRKEITGSTLRLYGSAGGGDPPYVIYIHPDCTESNERQIMYAKLELSQTVGNWSEVILDNETTLW